MNTPAPMSDIELPECEAIRYNFDGYGWDYRDNGSGSLWRLSFDVHQPEGLYSRKQMKEYAAECVAARDAMWSEMLGKVLEDIANTPPVNGNNLARVRVLMAAEKLYAMHKNIKEIDTSENSS